MLQADKPYRLTGSWPRAAAGVLQNAFGQNGHPMGEEPPGDATGVREIDAEGFRVEETLDGVRSHTRAVTNPGLLVDQVHVRFETRMPGDPEGVEITELDTDIGFRWYDEDLRLVDIRPIVTKAACAHLTAGELAERLYRCLFAMADGQPLDDQKVAMPDLIAKAQALRVELRDAGGERHTWRRTRRYAFRRVDNQAESMALPDDGARAAVIARRMRAPQAWRSRTTDWHDDNAEYTGDASADRLHADATAERLEKAGYRLEARLPTLEDEHPAIEIWADNNIGKPLCREAGVRVIDDGSGTTRVTTESGATTLAKVTPERADAVGWRVTEIHPTGIHKHRREGSYPEALGRAVAHALERRRNG